MLYEEVLYSAANWDPKVSSFSVLNVRVVCDDSNQTWFHTVRFAPPSTR